MTSLSPIESSILARHPDEMARDLVALAYLRVPKNAGFLAEYEATWADVIATRRIMRSTTSISP